MVDKFIHIKGDRDALGSVLTPLATPNFFKFRDNFSR